MCQYSVKYLKYYKIMQNLQKFDTDSMNHQLSINDINNYLHGSLVAVVFAANLENQMTLQLSAPSNLNLSQIISQLQISTQLNQN